MNKPTTVDFIVHNPDGTMTGLGSAVLPDKEDALAHPDRYYIDDPFGDGMFLSLHLKSERGNPHAIATAVDQTFHDRFVDATVDHVFNF